MNKKLLALTLLGASFVGLQEVRADDAVVREGRVVANNGYYYNGYYNGCGCRRNCCHRHWGCGCHRNWGCGCRRTCCNGY